MTSNLAVNGGSVTLAGDLAVNGGDITTSSTGTATVFNNNATTLCIGEAAPTVFIGATTGTATIRNATTALTGNATVGGTLGVTNAATLSNTLNVTGATTLSSTLNVTGATTLSSTLNVTGNTTTPTAVVNAVKFPAVQVASADVNTLDDYKEGTWTPTVSFGGSSVGITYDTTNTKGRYVKIGNTVFAWGRVILTSKGSSTGIARVSLPITSLSSLPVASVTVPFSYQLSGTLTGGYIGPSENNFYPVISSSSNAMDTNFTDVSDFMFSCFYSAED